jgi:hypothetical protein
LSSKSSWTSAADSSSAIVIDASRRRRPVGERLHARRLLVELVLDLADQLLEDVLERDEPGGAAVLVHDDAEVDALLLDRARTCWIEAASGK